MNDGSEATAPGIPALLPSFLLEWYDQNARNLPWRRDREPYHVWLSEIMLQQTGVETVRVYYERFLRAFPTVEALASTSEQAVLKLWEGLGYYSRARNLHKTAKIVTSVYGGRFPETAAALLSLPGVGDYTAGAIASICFGQPAAAVDGNVLRVVSRLTSRDYPGQAGKKRAAAMLEAVYPPDRCGDFTQSLMELGALVCIPNGAPKCPDCPARSFCEAYRAGTVSSFPAKRPRKEKRGEVLTVFILTCAGRVALRRREDGGLLGGLWELPNVPCTLGDEAAFRQAANWGVRPDAPVRSFKETHIFTHVKWDMTCYHLECAARPELFVWTDSAAPDASYTMPTAFKKLLDRL